jgi:hypothetical protein
MLTALLVAGCSVETERYQGPERPAGLPEAAFWAGGPDGGHFFLIEKDEDAAARLYKGTIYHELGDVIYEGPLVLDPTGSPAPDLSDHSLFYGWDGGRVLLSDGRQLTARPLRPENVPEGAVWTYGPGDGGVFVIVDKRAEDPADIYRGAVYHPDGVVWYEGAFRLQPSASPALDLTDPHLLHAWTGEQLLVSGERQLLATDGM